MGCCCCITKAVLEQSGKEYPNLKMMELKELSCMVSLHFRKCCRAYNDIKRETSAQDLNMMNWIFRRAALFERLKATQDKIDKIKSGKIKIENLLETQNVCKDEPKTRRAHNYWTGTTLSPISYILFPISHIRYNL